MALAAEVHNSTVSLALRDSPLIPLATRRRIQAIAEQMGYRSDPLLRALNSYRESRRANRPRPLIAILTRWPTPLGWRGIDYHERGFSGMTTRAMKLGFQWEHFCLNEFDAGPRALDKFLADRGVTGVVFGAHHKLGGQMPELDWNRMRGVQIGRISAVLSLPVVKNDEPDTMRIAIQQIRAAGYSRAGFVVAETYDEQSNNAWSMSFHAEQFRKETGTVIPPLRLPDNSGTAALDTLGKWYRAHHPEVVLSLVPNGMRMFESLGLNIPADLALVDLCLSPGTSGIAGISQMREKVGACAIDALAQRLQQSTLGLPDFAVAMAVTGNWIDGLSLPPHVAISSGNSSIPENTA